MRKFFTVAAALLLAACNPMAQMDGADEQIEQFHEHYNAGNLDGLWAMTGPELREAAPRPSWDSLVTLVDERLGEVVESSQTGFNINTNNGETTTVITRSTTFEQDEGIETFTFFGSGDDMRLAGWEVESDALRGNLQPAPAMDEATAGGKPGAEGPVPADAEAASEKP